MLNQHQNLESPDEETSNPRGIRITAWKPYVKNTLKGFLTAVLPSGLVLRDLMLHEKNGNKWLGYPSREWENSKGEKQFAQIIEFRDRECADRFRDAVLAALDEHLRGGGK